MAPGLLDKDTVDTLLKAENKPMLIKLLTYHMVPAPVIQP